MAKGKVIQVIGTVVDIEFPPDELPELFSAIEIARDGDKVVLDSGVVPQKAQRGLSSSAGLSGLPQSSHWSPRARGDWQWGQPPST